MKTHLRVLAIVVFILMIGTGTASAYTSTNAQSVIVELDGVPRMVTTTAQTVGDFLTELDATVDTQYLLATNTEADEIANMMTISLTSTSEKIVASSKILAYETIERESKSLAAGETKVVQEGKDGVATTITKQYYEGKTLVSSEVVETKVSTEATPKIIEVGVSNMVDGIAYTSTLNVKATAYTPYDAGCNGITSTGAVAKKGIIAVDPKVIPYGTKVYIPGYGMAIAGDTGGAIKGNRIDLCYETKSEAFGWGVKNITIYVVS